MNLAVMQPYLFPYIGYFQLIKQADTFIIYDNVQYSKGGWINRNRVLMNGEDLLWSFSIQNDTLDTNIDETYFTDQLARECKKFLRTLQISYGRAPFYDETRELVEEVFERMDVKNIDEDIGAKIGRSIQYISDYLELETDFIFASALSKISGNTPQERILHLCSKLNADTYINLPGGKSLYDFQDFKKKGIQLFFLEPLLKSYPQDSDDFIPGLSIIDVLMFNDKSKVSELLNAYQLTSQKSLHHHARTR